VAVTVRNTGQVAGEEVVQVSRGDGGEMVVEFMKERMDLIDGYIMIYLHIYSFKEIEITNQPF